MSDSDLELDHQEEEEFGARPYMFEPEMSSDSDGNNSDSVADRFMPVFGTAPGASDGFMASPNPAYSPDVGTKSPSAK